MRFRFTTPALIVSVAVLACLATACSPIKGSPTLPPAPVELDEYIADFSSGCSDWFLERFNCGEGYLSASTTGYSGHALLQGIVWDVKEIESRFTINGFGEYGRLRFTWGNQASGNSYYALTFGETTTQMWRYDDGATTLLKSNPGFAPTVGETYDVRIAIDGNQFEVYVDGELVLEVSDPLHKYPTGPVGIRASNTISLRVDSYTVKGNILDD